jgi:hypothetical protein
MGRAEYIDDALRREKVWRNMEGPLKKALTGRWIHRINRKKGMVGLTEA